jgi:hypothetical protein
MNTAPNRDDICIYNNLGKDIEISIEIYNSSSKIYTRDTALGNGGGIPESSLCLADPINRTGQHIINVSVESGPSGQYMWDVSGVNNTPDETVRLHINIYNNTVSFERFAG